MPPRKRNLTKQERQIVAQIKRLYRRDEPLNITAVKRRHPQLMAAVYATKPYWGWKRALQDARIDYKNIRTELQDHVVCEKCGSMYANLSRHLISKHQITSEEYREQYPDAQMVCETTRVALFGKSVKEYRVRGMPPHWERIWSDEYVLDRLWERHSRGFAMNIYSLEQHDPALVRNARRRFGSWNETLRKVGLDPLQIRRNNELMAEEEVLKLIRHRWKSGASLNSIRLIKKGTQGMRLYIAGIEHFGSWREAVEAAGIDYDDVVYLRLAARKRVVREIKLRNREGRPLNDAAVSRGPVSDISLYSRALVAYGAWGKAITAAGLRYEDIRISTRQAAATDRGKP